MLKNSVSEIKLVSVCVLIYYQLLELNVRSVSSRAREEGISLEGNRISLPAEILSIPRTGIAIIANCMCI